jgi:signal transduction histidine kinase/PAS domain-containing protein
MEAEAAARAPDRDAPAGPAHHAAPASVLAGPDWRARLAWRIGRRWLAESTFAPAWLPEPWRHPAIGYVAAALLQVAATLVSLMFVRAYPEFVARTAVQFVAIALAAFVWGAGPSLLATGVGAVLLDYVLLPPYFSWSSKGADNIGVVVFVVVGLAFSYAASQTERARRAAESSARQLEATFDAMAEGVLVCDVAGRIVQVNANLRRLVAIDLLPEYVQLPERERARLLAPRDLDGTPLRPDQWPHARLLRGEVLSEANAVEAYLRTLDGREVEVSYTGAPIRGADGRITGAVVVLRDVTGRRRLERRPSEALQALLEMAQALVSVATPQDASAPASQQVVARRLAELTCSVLGCERVAVTAVDPRRDTMRQLAVVGLTPQQEAHLWATPDEIPLEAGGDPTLVERLRAGEAVVRDMARPQLPDRPNPYGALSVLSAPCLLRGQLVGILTLDYGSAPHDYTPSEVALAEGVSQLVALVIERERLLRERAEAQASELALREANRRMDEFLGIASHELKTPLTTFTANIQLLERRFRRAAAVEPQADELSRVVENAKSVLMGMRRSSARLNRLVDDLLDVTRIREGRLEFRTEAHDLAAIVQEAVTEQRQQQPERDIRLELPATTPVPVVADADRISQVITNYLTNALKYSSEDCPVEVRLATAGAVARLSVRDEGPGIPLAEQERIWDMFYRAESVRVQSGSGVGLGLGLHISRTIVARHHGQVGVESEVGKGSTFWFTLPLAAD